MVEKWSSDLHACTIIKGDYTAEAVMVRLLDDPKDNVVFNQSQFKYINILLMKLKDGGDNR